MAITERCGVPASWGCRSFCSTPSAQGSSCRYSRSDDTANRRFILALDESLRFVSNPLQLKPAEREYAERIVKQRLHQPEFRGRILLAYQTRCTVCALRRGKLLDAAHIIADNKTGPSSSARSIKLRVGWLASM